MGEERINICYALSDKTGDYTKIAGASICSVLENTRNDVSIHILHDGTLTKRNVDYLYELVDKKFRQELCLYDVSTGYKDIWDKINIILPDLEISRLNIATFFRLIMGEVLSHVKRIIYLDADVIVNMDINELWREQTGINGVGAAPDPFIQKYHHNITRKALVPQREYFNAGVLLIDLEKFRKLENLMDKAMDFLKKHKPDYLDQDILNYFFPRSCVLDGKYNSVVWMEQEDNKPVSRRIYHYVNNCLGIDMRNEYNALFFSYFSRTPWCDATFIGNMFKMVEQVRFEMLDFGNICANRRRILIASEKGRESICRMLKLGGDEVFIPFEKMGEYKTDFNKGRDVFLLALNMEEYIPVKQQLKSLGLVENVHFVNCLQKLGLITSDLQDYKLFLHC